MSDLPTPGWWQASDGRWYPPPQPSAAPPPGQPQYGQPQYGQPQFGQPQFGQPQYGQPQYGQPQYGYGAPFGPPQGLPPTPPKNGLALAALVLGIGSLAVSVIPLFGYVAAPFALIGLGLGIAGIGRARTISVGKGMAVAGLVTSIIAVIVLVAWTIVFVVVSSQFGPVDASEYRVSDERCEADATGAISYTATFTNLGKETRPFEITVEFTQSAGDTSATYATQRMAPGTSTRIIATGRIGVGVPPVCSVVDVIYNGS